MFIPEKDWVVIEPLQEESVTASGLVLAEDKTKNRPGKAKVLAVGPGMKYPWSDESGQIHLVHDKTETKPGDIILYLQHGKLEFYHEGKDHIWVREANILGRLPKIETTQGLSINQIDYDARS